MALLFSFVVSCWARMACMGPLASFPGSEEFDSLGGGAKRIVHEKNGDAVQYIECHYSNSRSRIGSFVIVQCSKLRFGRLVSSRYLLMRVRVTSTAVLLTQENLFKACSLHSFIIISQHSTVIMSRTML